MRDSQHNSSPEAARHCPQCGGDNQCAVAGGMPAEACWCHAVIFSPAALASPAAAGYPTRCLCRACAGSDASGGGG